MSLAAVPPRRRARWAGRLLYAGVVLALLELTARAYFWATGQDIEVYRNFTTTRIPHMMLTDPVLGWRLQPGVTRNVHTSDFQITYHTNRLGLRDLEADPTDGYDILFLGDSQTFGEGVELGQRFSDRVRDALPGVRTLNAAVPGWGLHQMAGWFELEGWHLRPELVVCAVIEGDLTRAVLAQVPAQAPAQLIEDPEEYAWAPPSWRPRVKRLERALRRSYVYAVFSTRARIAWLARGLAERDRKAWAVLTGGVRPEGQPDRPDGPAPDEAARQLRETSARLFRELDATARAAGSRLLVVNIDDHSLHWLDRQLAQDGIAYADLADALRGASDVRYRIDPHYNARGHERLAAALAPVLRERYDFAERNPGADVAALEHRAAALRADPGRLVSACSVGYGGQWLRTRVPAKLAPGAAAEALVEVRNTGPGCWPTGAGRGGWNAVRLAHRWLSEGGREAVGYGTHRVDLPVDVPPGASALLSDEVQAPSQPGSYVLQFDLVNEGVAWFQDQGLPKNLVPVEVR